MSQAYIDNIHIEEFLDRAEKEFPNDYDIIREIKERLEDLKTAQDKEYK